MKGIAFDLEGTCVDIEELHFKAYERALAEFDISIFSTDIAKIPGAVGGGAAFVFAGLSPSHPHLNAALLRERKTYHFKLLFDSAELRPRAGLTDYIESALSHDYPISIGSTTARAFGNTILERTGLNQYFRPEYCVFREDVSYLKPSPDVYIQTASIMHVRPDEQLVFEDSLIGINAARDACSQVIAMPVPFILEIYQREIFIENGATKCCYSWSEVARQFSI